MLNQRSSFLSNIAVLGVICSSVGFGAVASSSVAVAGESSQSQMPFTFGALVAKMKAQAQDAYLEPTGELPEALANLKYDGYRKIGYKRDRSKWKDTENFRVHAFHPGWLFKNPLKIHEVSEGAAQPFVFEAADFDYQDAELTASLNDVSFPGVAGFRLLNPLNVEGRMDELVAFLGASYFRALGAGNVYGLSARALAIDTASGKPEEFPNFTAFYLGKPVDGSDKVTVWAELDSPSVTGAYQFVFKPGQQTEVDVTAHLFFRSDVERLGIAPLTSMYLYGENDRVGFDDFRPEVHDSDGLKLRFANGKTAWRPLSNPDNLQLSFIGARSPAGFGLMQRDKDLENYQDLEARYDKRPSLWIEPLGDWGSGAVMLAEIPTDQEINDNVVAFWSPNEAVKAGDELSFHYKMYWGDEVGRSEQMLMPVVQTRSGKAGHSASEENSLTRKFVVDFDAELFAESGLDGEQLVRAKPFIENAALNGTVNFADVRYIEELGVYRVFLDVSRDDLEIPVELRLQLTDGEKAVSEEWLYQWGWSS
ncbi:glucans biosynthesis protein [Pseudovibrio ascidiaceicola]|uniref:Glucans biosynthesis protein n=1 Tax=Pseudovibrio ascidiaceicola TaxID=285279 RepID=A0A1I4ERV2_9HYPH|nr:glucan biosynthesis protein [Pseudovibrio ascidiaceicola]SFL08049.1 glucans biosynthesis protein [Pseudovibrio ascidiaceicola]